MKCFYHNDLDGKASAFCVHTWAGIKDVETPIDFISINYGTPFPFNTIKPNEQIWIVDYSIDPSEMLLLLDITKDVTWIDHHKTAIAKYVNFPHKIRGIRKDGVAACVLTWKYLHWWTGRGEGKEDFDAKGEIPVADCIVLTGDRDVWNWKFGDTTKNFYAGSQLYNTNPDSSFWWNCLDHEIKPLPLPNTGNATAQKKGQVFWDKLLLSGEVIEKYKLQFYKELTDYIGYETTFEGYKCFTVNVARISSDVFGDLIKQYDILLPHYHDGKQWTVSLYTKSEIDVSEIAKKYGGGGHKQASGFQCDALPFSRK